MATETLCSEIAQPEIIITERNLHGLMLSNYNRSPGTQVKITCLSPSSHKLIGQSMVTCLPNGSWNHDIPSCISKKLLQDSMVVFPGSTEGNTGGFDGQHQWSRYEMLPYIVALTILGIACLILICLLSYMICSWKRGYPKGSSILYDSSRSSIPASADQTDFWVEMATPRNFRCHELAQSRDSMVQNLRYTHLHPDWSGY